MKKSSNIFIDKEYRSLIKKDDDNMILLSYDLNVANIPIESTEGILRKVEPILYRKLTDFFKIDLKDYGVEILDEKEQVINQ